MMVKINGVKFGKHGVKDEAGKYTAVHYSFCTRTDGSESVTIYARHYKSLPASLNPKNGTDISTDYFENDKVEYLAGSNEYAILKEHFGKKEEVSAQAPAPVATSIPTFVPFLRLVIA